MAQQLPFAPYHLLLQTLSESPVREAEEEGGVACHKELMKVGVVHQVLNTLASLGHRLRATPTDSAPDHPSNSLSTAVRGRGRGRGVTAEHRLYWAKGTGFATGSITSAWNTNETKSKQKSVEKMICLCLAILSEYLSAARGCGEGAESWRGSALADLLASSCLLPVLATYLMNDSSKRD